MASFFAKAKIFIFRPKTMDYSPWFDVWESEISLEKRISRGAEWCKFSVL